MKSTMENWKRNVQYSKTKGIIKLEIKKYKSINKNCKFEGKFNKGELP